MRIEIIETPRGPMEPAPKVSVLADGKPYSEAYRQRGWLVAEIPDEEEGSREVRGKDIRDLRIRARAL